VLPFLNTCTIILFSFHLYFKTFNHLAPKKNPKPFQKRSAGINSFKFYLAYKGALMVSDEQLIQGFMRCKELGALPQIHGENGDAVVLWQRKVFEDGITGPEGHALSRPAFVSSWFPP
jgi:dihydropyrimidinase